MGGDVPVVEFLLYVVAQEDHDDVGLFGRLGHRHDLEPGRFGLLPAPAAFPAADDAIYTRITQVQGMGLALVAVTQDGHRFFVSRPSLQALS